MYVVCLVLHPGEVVSYFKGSRGKVRYGREKGGDSIGDKKIRISKQKERKEFGVNLP